MNTVTPAEPARWQRQPARTLATILAAHPNLPVLVWTVTAAGISARVPIVDSWHSAREHLTACTTTLGLHPRRCDAPDLDRSYLNARGNLDRTRTTLAAVIDRTR